MEDRPVRCAAFALLLSSALLPGLAPAAETRSLTLSAVEPGRDLALRVTLPRRARRALPVVVFSHGNYCEPARYGVLLDRIADAGYAVLVPEHLDRAPPPSPPLPGAATWPSRLADVRAVINRLPEIAALLPAGAPAFDSSRLALAGHSYGGAVAQAFGGARMYARDGSGRITAAADARVRAVIAWSPPAPMADFIDDTSAGSIDRPMLVATGTQDFSAMWPDWRLHARAFDTAAPGDKTLLVVEGMDHYLGGLACASKPTPPQPAQARLLAKAVIDFLEAQLRNAPASRARMRCQVPARWPGATLTCR